MALAIPNELERLRESAKRFANEFTIGQKFVVAIAVLGLAIGAFVFMSVSSAPTYAPLFTGLQGTDAASITSKLSSEHIPYQLQQDTSGTTVMVPQNDVLQQRIAMAQAGLPQSGTVGLSIVDKEGITTSDFTQQIDYQQGLQGELAKTIESINGVSSAQVNIVMGNQSQFALSTNNQQPSASVLVTMSGGSQLTSGQVQAIVHLVASSIPGLDSANVTVADSTGQLLAGPGVDQTAQTNLSQQNEYDNLVALQIQSQLDKVLGPGNDSVQVNAQLNFDKVSTTTQGIQTNPATGGIVTTPSQTSQTSTNFNGTGTLPGGVLGATTITGNGNQVNTYTQNQTQTNYDTGHFTQTVQQAPGKITQQSVSVLTNTLPPNVSQAALQTLVSTTADIVPARGDTVNVVTLPFSTSANSAQKQAAAAAAAAKRSQELYNTLKAVGLGLAILVILFLIWRSSRPKEELLPMDYPALPEEAGYGMEEDLEGYEELTEEHSPLLSPELLRLEDGLPQELEASSIGEFIDQQPEEVARLLRSWMQEARSADTRRERFGPGPQVSNPMPAPEKPAEPVEV